MPWKIAFISFWISIAFTGIYYKSPAAIFIGIAVGILSIILFLD